MGRPARQRVTGVYAIVCQTTGYRYIGGAVDCDARQATHFRRLRDGGSHNKALQYAFDAFGEDNLKFMVLTTCSREELDTSEQQALDTSTSKLFNTVKSSRCPRGKMSQEGRVRLSEKARAQHAEGSLGRQSWRQS